MPTAVAAAASPTSRETGRGGHPRRRRRRRAGKSRSAGANAGAGEGSEESARPGPDPCPQVEVEYVPEKPGLGAADPLLLGAFAAVFEKFGLAGPAAAAPAEGEENEREGAADAAMNKGPDDAEQEAPKKEEEEAVVLSKKQRKQLRRVKISELRQMCSRPDVVEVWDGNAPDPKLLVCLKSCRNTVPVPRHWCQKRKYLQELEDGEIVEGIRQEEEEDELEEGEIVDGIRQEEEEEELEEGEIVEGIRQAGAEEAALEEEEIVEGIRQEEKEEEELEDGEIVEGIRSGYTISSAVDTQYQLVLVAVTPDVIDLGMSRRKEPEKQAEKRLYQVLEQKEERVASASTPYLSSHRYVLVGAQDKPSTSTSSSSGLKSKRRLERVDVTIHPDQLDAVDDALAAKYRELWGEEGKTRRKLVGGEGSSWVSPPSWKTATKRRKKVDYFKL